MKKIILSLFIAFSLLVAPIAHAAGVGCQGDNCQMSEQTKKQAKSEKQQDNNKMAGAGHHCCCPHISINLNTALSAPETASSQEPFSRLNVFMSSVVQGPPLKPPSHA